MKNILYFIESNKRILEETEKQYELYKKDPSVDSETERLEKQITILKAYINGLEDAKKYIEEEKEEL